MARKKPPSVDDTIRKIDEEHLIARGWKRWGKLTDVEHKELFLIPALECFRMSELKRAFFRWRKGRIWDVCVMGVRREP